MENNNKLPTNLHFILIGLVLGDGHIYKSSPTSNSRFEMSFGKDRKLIALWISDYFKDYMNSGIKTVFVKTVFNYRLKTRSLSIFNYYHDLLYEKNLGNIKK